MKHQYLVYATIGLVVFFVAFNVDRPSFTGMAVEESENIHAVNLNDVISDFFGVYSVEFPDSCGNVARDLYDNVAFRSIDDTAGFATPGNERIASINFVIDRTERIGTLDMLRMSPDTGENAMISLNVESAVWVARNVRHNFMAMDLFGRTADVFYVTRGRFSTPSIDCFFVVHKGRTVCDCKVHSISGISVAGITSYNPPDEYYDILMERAEIASSPRMTVN
ncbi:hypothetical protein KY309_02025 [Candidatus Woesearchaeota archaeon]|nr:hypothetical protein [Candidatus Woesearchaeota archaeon]MBW3016365.1 hypothetical protein [Candidatus Woesearchaeota archaeon]